MTNLKTYFKELFEAETFKARSKESGKLVQFKSKDSYDAAIKAGSHEDPKAPKSGKAGGSDSKKDVPKVNIFDKPASTDKAQAKHTKVGPDAPEVKTISQVTGIREKFLSDFINKHKLDASAVADFVKNGSLKDRKDFGTAAVGNPGNEYEKKIIDKFGDKSEPASQSEPKQSSKPDRFGDKFELGTPAVYNDNGKEYSGEVVMNPSNQRVQIGGQWTTIGKGTTKGIQVYGSDTFIVPDNWNDVQSFDDATEKPSEQPKQPRKGNPEVNKATKSAAEEAGITPQKLGGEYKDTMYKAAIEALTDSNYHDEARELISKLEGKPEWAKKPEYPSMDDPKYNEKMKALKATGVDSSEYWDYDDNTGRFARKVSSGAGWDGAHAVDGIAFTLRMNGFHKEADMIQSVIKESVTRLTTILKETTYSKKKSKSKSLNEDVNFRDGKYRFYSKDGVGYLTYDGKEIADGDYDYEGGNAYYMNHSSFKGGQNAFKTGKDVIAYFKKNKITNELINEASEPDVISQLKDIVKNQQYETIKDPKSGKKMKVDMQTANAVLQIYNGLSNVNKDNMVKMGLPKMIEVSYKIISKYR